MSASGDSPGDSPLAAASTAAAAPVGLATAPAPVFGRRAGRRRPKRTVRPAGTRPLITVVPRPGSTFHARMLALLSYGVAVDPAASPASELGTVWVTPPRADACFSVAAISGLMAMFFCEAPAKLFAAAAGDGVFSVPVASPEVARAVVEAPPWRFRQAPPPPLGRGGTSCG